MQIKHIPVRTASILPKGLLQYVDRGTLELCLHLIVLSLSLVSEKVYHGFIYIELVILVMVAVCTHFMKSHGFTCAIHCFCPNKQFSAPIYFLFLIIFPPLGNGRIRKFADFPLTALP